MPYSRLDADKIIQTARMLDRRVGERFPDSSLASVTSEIVTTGERLATDAQSLEQPVWWLRILTLAGVLAGAVIFVFVGTFLNFDRMTTGGFDFVQAVEAGINTMVLAGLGLFALVNLETRFKRQRVLKGLHELRSLIHVIDMHQLTKDPSAFDTNFRTTDSSPQRALLPWELKRYLDYCSEALSMTGKFAALYAQSVADIDVADAVNDIETLGTNLSRKIWQKIMLINAQSPTSRQKKTQAAKGLKTT